MSTLTKGRPRVEGHLVSGAHSPSQDVHNLTHLVMEGRDEPELHLQAGASLLSGNELQQVLVLHARCAKDLPFTLP